MKKLILAVILAGLITIAAACPQPTSCPWLTIEKICYKPLVQAGIYHVKATADGTYALEVHWGGVVPKVEESTSTVATTGTIMGFTTAILPFRIMWWSVTTREWLPASNLMLEFPDPHCVIH